MANHLTKKLIISKKSALIDKNVKLKKITIIKKAKSLQNRKKKILVNKKAEFKKITLLKKRKKGRRFWDNKALLEKRAAHRRRRRERKLRKKQERSRREVSHLQLVSGDSVTIPVEHSIETLDTVGTVGTVNTVNTVEETETQPIDYVSGELYNPIFSFSIESPIQVDSQLWDSIKENLPDNYMIPDPEFLEAVCIEDLPIEISAKPVLSWPIEVPIESIFIEPEEESQSKLTKADAAESD